MASSKADIHYRKLEAMYTGAPINASLAPSIEVRKGHAIITAPVLEEYFHAAGALHGSISFKMLDDAAYFAVSSLVRDVFILTVSFTTYFLRPVREGILRAEGHVVSKSPQLFVAESELFVGDKRIVGRGSGTFTRSRITLAELTGTDPQGADLD